MPGLASPGRLDTCLYAMAMEHKKKAVAAFFIQEHNLPPSVDVATIHKAGSRYRMLWIAGYKLQNDTRTKGHGTAIVIPYDSVELKDGESLHDAVNRVKKTRQAARGGRVTSAVTLLGGRTTRLTAAYAPTGSEATSRPEFFRTKLAPFVTPSTVLGIDANCVPDPVLDVNRPAADSAYDNRGAQELSDLVSGRKLTDVAREQLGLARFYTAHHAVAAGVTHTRIDRIYVPTRDGLL